MIFPFISISEKGQLSWMHKSEVEKMEEGWRNLNSEEVHNVCLHQMSLIHYIEKLKMGGTCDTKGEMGNAYKY